jgi:phage/plasmid-associated DNA primase
MNISLKELTKERFAPANLCDKTCNISPDETNIEILDTGTLKRLSGGDNITADKKFSVDMVSFKSVVKLLVSMNEDLSFADNTHGFSRRVRVIPFKGTFEKRKS